MRPIDPNEPSYPVVRNGMPTEPGLPIRLEIASRVMAGMVANPNTGRDLNKAERENIATHAAEVSLAMADALIAAHNQSIK